MSTSEKNNKWYQMDRIAGLRRFAIAVTGLNLLGHTFLGFEQSWAQPLVAVATAYAMELLVELVDAWAKKRPLRFLGGGPVGFVDFLLSAHITGLVVSMLIYANEALWPVAFGAAIAVGSKVILRIPIGGGTRHFMNPSNFGITVLLLLFPWIGIAPPYMFTENLIGVGDWILPALIIISGSFLNYRFTHKLPLLGAWLGFFVLQAVFRSVVFDAPIAAAWMPMTGMGFVLYTFYMVTDPATTPSKARAQVVFGGAVAITYSLLIITHVVFGLFFALTIVCAVRGLMLYGSSWAASRTRAKVDMRPPVLVKEA